MGAVRGVERRRAEGQRRGIGGGWSTPVLVSCMAVVCRPYTSTSHPQNAGTEHVGCLPTRQALIAPWGRRG